MILSKSCQTHKPCSLTLVSEKLQHTPVNFPEPKVNLQLTSYVQPMVPKARHIYFSVIYNFQTIILNITLKTVLNCT